MSILLFLLLLPTSLPSTTTATNPPPTSPESLSTLCDATLYPAYCNLLLNHTATNVYEYGYLSVKQSISQANMLVSLVNRYLSLSRYLTPSAVGPLEDCLLLAQLNLDFLTDSLNTLSGANNRKLSFSEADDVQTLLSGIITNQETCLDGLQSISTRSLLETALSAPLAIGTKLYSISLALINKGWVPTNKKGASKGGRSRPGLRHGQLPRTMSNTNRHISGSVGRRLLADGDDDEEVMINDIVTVSQDGSGNFTTIMDAVAAAPNNTDGTKGYFLIYVTAGEYAEYVTVDKKKKYVMMVGDGINQTIITGNRSVADNYTTFHSATFAVAGTGFVGVNMTIRNTAGAINHQAVALRNSADYSTFYGCSFEGYQDTLYTHNLRQFYRECDIYGTVDFIFGNAAVVFQACNIYARLPLFNQFNAVTAQGRTEPGQTGGISIQNCTLRPADDLAVASYTVESYLGRPWKNHSRTVYMESYMDGFVNPVGWREWNGTFGLDTIYYGEFNNTGPGSDTANRVTWPGYSIMNASDAVNFTVSNFLLATDWLYQTGVPYYTGFLST